MSCMTEHGMQLSDLSSSCEFLFPLASISYFVSCILGIVIEGRRIVFKQNRNIRNSKTSNHGRPVMCLSLWQTGFVVTFPSCGSWRHFSPILRLRGELFFFTTAALKTHRSRSRTVTTRAIMARNRRYYSIYCGRLAWGPIVNYELPLAGHTLCWGL